MAEGSSDTDAAALRRLEERLDRAVAAAERLLGDAVVTASGGGGGGGSGSGAGGSGSPPRIPPAGWQQPPPEGESGHGRLGGDLDLLLAVLASVRDRIPPELQQRLIDAVREVLMAVRAVIDWYLERTESRRPEPQQVQDIPIL